MKNYEFFKEVASSKKKYRSGGILDNTFFRPKKKA